MFLVIEIDLEDGNEEINNLTWEWFLNATSWRVNINEPLIQEKVL